MERPWSISLGQFNEHLFYMYLLCVRHGRRKGKHSWGIESMQDRAGED